MLNYLSVKTAFIFINMCQKNTYLYLSNVIVYMKIPNYDVEDEKKNNFKQLYDFMPNRSFMMHCITLRAKMIKFTSGKVLIWKVWRLLMF